MTDGQKIEFIDIWHKVKQVKDWRTRLEKVKKAWAEQEQIKHKTPFLTLCKNEKPGSLSDHEWNTFVRRSAFQTVPQFEIAIGKFEKETEHLLVKK